MKLDDGSELAISASIFLHRASPIWSYDDMIHLRLFLGKQLKRMCMMNSEMTTLQSLVNIPIGKLI